MTTPSRADLSARLERLYSERLGKEMSDDFAYSNGSIAKIDREIRQVQAELDGLSE